MYLEELKKLYDQIYDKISKELEKHYYCDDAIVDGLSTGVHGNLKGKIDEKYLPFLEYVTKQKRKYDGGYSAKELLEFIQTRATFSFSQGIEAPLSLMCIYFVEGKLMSLECFFARDTYEAEDDGQCDVGYKIGIGFDGTNFSTLKYRLSTGKITRSKWSTPKVSESADDFKIVKGVLKKYTGKQSRVVIPDDVISIGQNAFLESKYSPNLTLECVVMGESVTTIESEAFKSCKSLKMVIIPASVTYIDDDAFDYCEKIENFLVDENNPCYKSVGGNLYTKDFKKMLRYTTGKKDKSFEVSDGVTIIGKGAFSCSKYITEVTIPDSVSVISTNAFSFCTKLKCVSIPYGVAEIADFAFGHCSSLTSITIPLSVTRIGNCAFSDCEKLINIDIPNGVNEIGNSAFGGCSSLNRIEIPNGVTIIGNYAFRSCKNLSYISIPKSVRSMGEGLFQYCDSVLIKVDVGSWVESYLVRNGIYRLGDEKSGIRYTY